MKIPAFKGALVPAAALYNLFLGLETGGFQYSLLKLARDFSLGSAAMGLLPAAQYTALTLAPLLMGRLSDRVEKKGLFLLGILCAALGCGLAVQARSALMLGLCVFLVGWGQGLGEFVSAALLTDVYPNRSGSYMNLVQCFFSLGAVISPLLTAYCTAHFGASWHLPFLLAAIGQLLALAWAFLADCAPAALRAAAPREGEAPFSPWRSPALLLLMAGVLLYVSIENGAAYFFDPLFSLEFRAAGYSAYAISAFWLAMFLSRLLFGVLRLTPQRLMPACLLGLSLCLLPPALSRNAGWALAACLGVGFLCGPIWPLLVHEASRVQAGHSGAATAAALTITGVGSALSPALMGLLGSFSNYRQVFAALSGLGVLAIALWLTYSRQYLKKEKRAEASL